MWNKLLLILVFICPIPAQSAGMFTHYLMAKKALQLMRNQQLKFLLQKHFKEFENGVVFPDTGYLMHGYGESAHWDTFFTPYGEYLREKCSGNFDHNYHCEQMLAHYLGSITHSISDANWDHHFVSHVANLCYQGDADYTGYFTDRIMDQIVLYENRFQYKSLRRWAPVEDLSTIYLRMGRTITPQNFKQATGLFFLLRNILRAFSSIFVHSTRNICSWASNNYMNARGGVNDTAQVVANFLEEIWAIIEPPPMFHKVPKLTYNGRWPYITFSVAPL